MFFFFECYSFSSPHSCKFASIEHEPRQLLSFISAKFSLPQSSRTVMINFNSTRSRTKRWHSCGNRPFQCTLARIWLSSALSIYLALDYMPRQLNKCLIIQFFFCSLRLIWLSRSSIHLEWYSIAVAGLNIAHESATYNNTYVHNSIWMCCWALCVISNPFWYF